MMSRPWCRGGSEGGVGEDDLLLPTGGRICRVEQTGKQEHDHAANATVSSICSFTLALEVA